VIKRSNLIRNKYLDPEMSPDPQRKVGVGWLHS